MNTFLAAAALGTAGTMTVQAAEVFTCRGVGYAVHDGKVELACTAPVTTHWTKLGGHSSALVDSINEPDGPHVAVTIEQGMREKVLHHSSNGVTSRTNGAEEVME
jgi:hypothetical protein